MVLSVLVEQAVEQSAQFNLLLLGKLVAAAHQAVPRQTQFRVGVDEVLKNIGHVPGDAQPHLHLAGHPRKLLVKGAPVLNQNFMDGLRVVGDGAEGHR